MFLQSSNNNCDKDLIPYQNQKYYKVKNNADSDYYVDQLRVFIYFWKRHLGYIHKYTHTTPAQIVFARTDFLGRPLKQLGVHTLTHERTGARTCPHRIHNIHRESSNNFHTNFYPEQMKVNLKHKHCVILDSYILAASPVK